MRKLFIIGIIIATSFSSCGILFLRKVKCREYKLATERFWFQGNLIIPYTFINKSTGEKKTFYVRDRWISHRNSYTSDTGCGCLDMSSQLLTSENDSIWIINESRYIERNKPETSEKYTFVINGKKTIIKSILSSVVYDSITVNESTHLTKKIKNRLGAGEVEIGELIGIISMQLNDEIWERLDIKEERLCPIIEYRYMFNYCY